MRSVEDQLERKREPSVGAAAGPQVRAESRAAFGSKGSTVEVVEYRTQTRQRGRRMDGNARWPSQR